MSEFEYVLVRDADEQPRHYHCEKRSPPWTTDLANATVYCLHHGEEPCRRVRAAGWSAAKLHTLYDEKGLGAVGELSSEDRELLARWQIDPSAKPEDPRAVRIVMIGRLQRTIRSYFKNNPAPGAFPMAVEKKVQDPNFVDGQWGPQADDAFGHYRREVGPVVLHPLVRRFIDEARVRGVS